MNNRFFWIAKAPILRIIIALIWGIVLGMRWTVFISGGIIVLSISLFILFTFQVFIRKWYGLERISGACLVIAVFIFGFVWMNVRKADLKYIPEAKYKIALTLSKEPKETNKSIKIFGKAFWADSAKESIMGQKEILLYLPKDSVSRKLHIGSQILINAYLNEFKTNTNPNAVDFKKIYEKKYIYYQAFVHEGEWRYLGEIKWGGIMIAAGRIRNKVLDLYRDYNFGKDEFGILSSLTLGYKNEIDEDLLSSYSIAGAMHILAVSGLHVGIIYIVLISLLGSLGNRKTARIVRFLIIGGSLVFYACLTGLTPSVSRATLMFLFLEWGRIKGKQTNVYNTILASALCLIIINPYVITYIGFQLSYAAVFSIVFLYKKIYGGQ